jgi:hypothetical protein
VPHRLLALFTPQELEMVVCGEPLDIRKLESSCCYESCRPSDELIRSLWTVLSDEFTDAERWVSRVAARILVALWNARGALTASSNPLRLRSRFLKFVLGTSRLPQTFTGRMTIAVDASKSCGHLPRARTCAFKLIIPPYPTREVLADKLRLAIHEETFSVEG